MYSQPTRATPAGCVLGLCGLAAWIYAGFSAWGLYLALSVSPEHRDPRMIRFLWLSVAIGFIGGAALLSLGWRLALRVDMSDPDNPRKPMIRF